MSYLSRAEIGPAIAMNAADAAKARKMLSDLEWLIQTVYDVESTEDGTTYMTAPLGISVSVYDQGPLGVSVFTRDGRERTKERAIHIHGRPAHFPEPGSDPRALLQLAHGLALQCVRVASSTKAMKSDDPRTAHSADARRHAQRLCAEAVASGYAPVGHGTEEIRVRHPWGDAQATDQYVLDPNQGVELGRSGTSEAVLERLLSVAVIGETSDRNIHIGGVMRTASPAAVASDPVEMMRLVAELSDLRSTGRRTSFT